MHSVHPRLLALTIGLASVVCAGCVEGQVRSYVKYDKDTDTFKCMQVYTNLHATQQKDLDHIEKMWARRNAILINPAAFEIFTTTVYERKGKHQFCRHSLGEPGKEGEVQSTRVDLDTIKVLPGEFYLNELRYLSYYHQAVVPGKTVDGLLEEVVPVIADFLAQEAEKQKQLAAKENVRRPSWEDFRNHLLEEIRKKDNPDGGPKKNNPQEELLPLEPASLQMLIKAGSDKAVKLSRTRASISLLIPFTNRDCKEILDTVNVVRTTVAERVKAEKPVEPILVDVLAAIRLRHVEGAGVEISVNLPRLFSGSGMDKLSPPDEKKRNGYLTTVTAVQEKGLKVNKDLSISDLVTGYKGR